MIVPVQLSLYIKDLFIFKILLLKNTHPLTQFAPFFKNLFFLLSFLFHPLLRYFDSSPYLTLMQPPPALIQYTNFPYT